VRSRPAGKRLRSGLAVRSEINVTPFVDVCLVLLIIFMVVTPLLQKGIDVQLPETDKPDRMPEGNMRVDLTVSRDGAVFVAGTRVPRESLRAALTDAYAQSPVATVVIRADRSLKFREVRELMRTVQLAGFAHASIETRQRDTISPR
jgi:biopolymer transport protein ExbD